MSHQSSEESQLRAFFLDDAIVIKSSRRQHDGESPLHIKRDQFSPEELRQIKPPWLKRIIQRVISHQTCVQRADVDQFESRILLPRVASREEKEAIWEGVIELLTVTRNQVIKIDQRTKLRAAS